MLYRYYQELWENPRPSEGLYQMERWNDRADEWVGRLDSDETYRKRLMDRVDACVTFLKKEEVLESGDRALDIGCGPGLFSMAFAKHVASVEGIDLSSRMVQHAANYAKTENLSNVAFSACDFRSVDVDAIEWSNRFDLVMACLTPAVTNRKELYKLMEVSRRHCLHISFVHARDDLEDRVIEALGDLADRGSTTMDGRIFYSIFNMLYLDGYFPKTHFYKRAFEDELSYERSLTKRYEKFLNKDVDVDKGRDLIIEALKPFVQKDGRIKRRTEECYGFILWDINDKDTSRKYEKR